MEGQYLWFSGYAPSRRTRAIDIRIVSRNTEEPESRAEPESLGPVSCQAGSPLPGARVNLMPRLRDTSTLVPL